MSKFKKWLRYSLYAALVILVVIQFIKPERNLSGNTQNDISKAYPVPDKVKVILETACYDCHSNKTVYPWYANIQPVAWWLSDHVNDGKKHLNFNEFMTYNAKRQHHKLEEIDETVMEGEMPMSSYTWIHKEADLSEDQKAVLVQWTKDLRAAISAQNPSIEEED